MTVLIPLEAFAIDRGMPVPTLLELARTPSRSCLFEKRFGCYFVNVTVFDATGSKH